MISKEFFDSLFNLGEEVGGRGFVFALELYLAW